jgi:hypothetical protein
MRLLAALGALCFLATTSLATAQIQVSAQTQRSDFLLYERVDLYVTVTNVGDSDLILNNDERPWLSFLVSKANRLPVRPEREGTFKSVALKAGESKKLKIDLTPLFSFREEGQYNAAAVINVPGSGDIISESVPFTVMRGRQVWSQTHEVDGQQRIYSLLRFSPTPDKTDLYLRVEDPVANLILANISLGEVVAYIDPEVFFDPQGNIHVMQPIAMSTYLYSRADPNGKILHQGIFKTFQQVPPRLTKLQDGNVVVAGGLEENPNTPRETLSQGQVKASAEGPATPTSSSALPADAPVSTP